MSKYTALLICETRNLAPLWTVYKTLYDSTLHLSVYNQLEPAAIKTPMPMPNVPVRRELLQPYRYLKGSKSSTVEGYASWKPLCRGGRRTEREPNVLTVVVDDSAVPENLLA